MGINNLNQRIDDRQSFKRARHWQKKKMSVSSLLLLVLLLLLPSSSSFSCGVPDPNCDPASSVWRAGPQTAILFSVACRTPTAILRIQFGVPDPNRDPVSSVWRAGPPNRDPVSSVWRAGPQVLCQKICQKE